MATITADSVALADVQTAVTAAGEGGTVYIPAGSATWDDNLDLTVGVTIIGAGVGNTVITSNFSKTDTSNTNSANFLIAYVCATPANNTPFRLSGMTIDLNQKCWGILLNNNTATAINQVRVDNISFSNVVSDAFGLNIMVRGTIWGVADHITSTSGYYRTAGIGLGSNDWTNKTYSPGSANNFYFEDCTLSQDDGSTMIMFYGANGGRYVARHNTINGSLLTTGFTPLCDMHGNYHPSTELGTMGAEIYENEIAAGVRAGYFTDQRGGRLLCYNNNVTTTNTWTARVREEYDDADDPPATASDGQPQHVYDSYFWGQTKNGVQLITNCPYVSATYDYGGAEGLVPQENRDFFVENASFDGSAGVGVGLLSARPSSGLTVGVGYWATDEEKLYVADSATTWELYYAPYTYPHPLQGANPWVMIYG